MPACGQEPPRPPHHRAPCGEPHCHPEHLPALAQLLPHQDSP
ncbi:unnamed protein product [Gulo gulo]|uniref:Uncharacterized protein n=1 Tax=Gulo gulo TaxID=48420 RepID=A0A9X9M093_GULGU|nr:unnamed protein product [Gulo gulo]